MKKGNAVLITRIGDSWGPDHPIEIGREFMCRLRYDLELGDSCYAKGISPSHGIETTTILSIIVIGRVVIFKTYNSVYMVQPLYRTYRFKG
jgi:hypothetical protein